MLKIVLANQDSSSHKLHCEPSNNAVIKQVTHMWESPKLQSNEKEEKGKEKGGGEGEEDSAELD